MKSLTDTFKLYSGVEIPCVGLGTWQSTDETAKNAVLSALSLGYRLIDTAAAYGNERGRECKRTQKRRNIRNQ